MKVFALFGVVALVALAGSTHAAETQPAGTTLYHVVSFKYKDSATPVQIKAVDEAFVALKTTIPGICSLHYGDNVSAEKHDHGFKQCFVLTFASAKDRDAYLVHPKHKAFGTFLQPVLADVMVVDFWGNE